MAWDWWIDASRARLTAGDAAPTEGDRPPALCRGENGVEHLLNLGAAREVRLIIRAPADARDEALIVCHRGRGLDLPPGGGVDVLAVAQAAGRGRTLGCRSPCCCGRPSSPRRPCVALPGDSAPGASRTSRASLPAGTGSRWAHMVGVRRHHGNGIDRSRFQQLRHARKGRGDSVRFRESLPARGSDLDDGGEFAAWNGLECLCVRVGHAPCTHDRKPDNGAGFPRSLSHDSFGKLAMIRRGITRIPSGTAFPFVMRKRVA